MCRLTFHEETYTLVQEMAEKTTKGAKKVKKYRVTVTFRGLEQLSSVKMLAGKKNITITEWINRVLDVEIQRVWKDEIEKGPFYFPP